MPRLAANVSMLFPELPFLERFAAAARAGFRYVEYQFPYEWPAAEVGARARAAGLEVVLHNFPLSDAQSKAVDMYERIVALRPDDATNQYRLASLAKDSGQSDVAIKAYTKFLSLSPNDSLAPAAREALAQLTASPAATVGGG